MLLPRGPALQKGKRGLNSQGLGIASSQFLNTSKWQAFFHIFSLPFKRCPGWSAGEKRLHNTQVRKSTKGHLTGKGRWTYAVRLPNLYLKGVYFKGVLIMYLKGCQIYIWKEVKYTFENKGRHNICSENKEDYDMEILLKGSCLYNGVKIKRIFLDGGLLMRKEI